MDDNVKDRQEAQAHVAKVDGQVLRLELHGRVDLVCKSLKVQLLWVFLVKEQQTFKSKEFCIFSLSLHFTFSTGKFLLHVHLVVAHVLVVPVTLQPVLRSVLLDKIVDSVPEVVGLQQQQLDYEVTNLSLVALMATHRLDEEKRSETRRPCHTVDIFLCMKVFSPHQTQDESVQGDYVVFPDHVVEYFDALVELLSAG